MRRETAPKGVALLLKKNGRQDETGSAGFLILTSPLQPRRALTRRLDGGDPRHQAGVITVILRVTCRVHTAPFLVNGL